MRTEVFRDTRLLDALEYIDDAYIASAARYKMKYTEEPHESKMTWRTPFKHSKIYIALAASLLVLAMASPLVNFITYVVSNFTAGAGSENTSEVVESTNGMYDEYILTEEDLAELNEACRKWRHGKKFADSVDEAMTQKIGCVYVGKFGNCIAFVEIDNPDINLYVDSFWVCYDSSIYSLDDAYEKGFLTYNDIVKFDEIYVRSIKNPDAKYDDYVLTLNELNELNNAYGKQFNGETFADSITQSMGRKTSPIYLGKFNDCIVFVRIENQSDPNEDSLWAYHDSFIYNINDAYKIGLLSEEDMQMISEVYSKRVKYSYNYQ